MKSNTIERIGKDKMKVDFEQVYSKYYGSVYRYIFSMAKDKYIAEEITQEAFYKALKNINKFNPEFKMLTWLCQIAKNTYYAYYKKNKNLCELDDRTIDSEEMIIEKIIKSEQNIEILKALHLIREPYKEVFTLRVYSELSFKQIGEIFNKSENWARVTYYRSKLKVKENLK